MNIPVHQILAQRLDWLADSCPDSPAIIEPERSIDYGTLSRRVHNLSGHFKSMGIAAGDRLALWLPNCIEWLASFLACARLGVTVISVNTRFKSVEVQDMIQRGKAQWLIYWPGFKGIDFEGILADVKPEVLHSLKGRLTLEDIQKLSTSDTQAAEPAPDHGAITFTTSGTTSLPKFVLHSQSKLLCHADAVAKAFGYDQSTRVLASTPFCGTFGFSTMSGALFTGRPVVCEPVSSSKSLLELIRRERITHTYANNSVIQEIMELSSNPEDFRYCRLFGFAAFAPALAELFEMAARMGLNLTGLYGSSELQALTAAQPTSQSQQGDAAYQREPGGVLVHPEARVRVRDPESGKILPLGQSGELEIKSPSVMLGYLDQPEATQKAMTEDGYFKTSDLGWCVSDRQFVFQARMGDSLRLSGFLVNPAEIEQVIETLPGIAQAQIVGAMLKGKLVPVAFVKLDAGAHANPELWTVQCKRVLSGFKVPVHFEVLDEFPTVQSANSTKIQKNRLRDMAQAILDQMQA